MSIQHVETYIGTLFNVVLISHTMLLNLDTYIIKLKGLRVYIRVVKFIEFGRATNELKNFFCILGWILTVAQFRDHRGAVQCDMSCLRSHNMPYSS